MSDDLISRKSLIENLNEFAPEHYTALVNDLIMKEPTAFDKEKVIEQIKVLSTGIILNTNICNDYAEGYVKAAKDMIAIVEKGGIDG